MDETTINVAAPAHSYFVSRDSSPVDVAVACDYLGPLLAWTFPKRSENPVRIGKTLREGGRLICIAGQKLSEEHARAVSYRDDAEAARKALNEAIVERNKFQQQNNLLWMRIRAAEKELEVYRVKAGANPLITPPRGYHEEP